MISRLFSRKFKTQAKYISFSVSVCSNVPDFTERKCFVNLDSDQLIEDTLEYVARIRNAAHRQATDRWIHDLSTLRYELEYMKQKQRDDDTTYEEQTWQRLSGENLR